MNPVKVLKKPVSLTYIHAHGDKRTSVDTSVPFDPANKVTMSYAFGSGNCKVCVCSWSDEENSDHVMIVSKNAWYFPVSRRFEGGDSIKATYQISAKILGLQWNRDSKVNGCFEISAFFNLAEQSIIRPKIMAERTLNYEFLFLKG